MQITTHSGGAWYKLTRAAYTRAIIQHGFTVPYARNDWTSSLSETARVFGDLPSRAPEVGHGTRDVTRRVTRGESHSDRPTPGVSLIRDPNLQKPVKFS